MRGRSAIFLFVALCAAKSYLPDQVRLAWSDRVDQVVVSWNTVNTTSDDYQGLVQYGLESGKYTLSVNGWSEPSYTCFNKAPKIHHGLLEKLTPSTTYFYRVGSTKDGYSKEFSFVTQPEANKYNKEGYRFAFYGDMGIDYSNYTIERVVDYMNAGKIDTVLHVGDISYANDRIVESHGTSYQDILNKFYNMIQPIAAHVPYMTAPGNHERECDFNDYKYRNWMPYNTSGSDTPMYYSFTTHRVHFVAISTEQHLQKPNPHDEKYLDHKSPQYKWLVQDLKKAVEARNRKEIDWIFVYGHRPLYCSYRWSGCCWDQCTSNDPSKWKNEITENIEELLHTSQVDFYLTGHTHTYERTWPVYKGKAYDNKDKAFIHKPSALMEIMSGAPGDIESGRLAFINPQPQWSAERIEAWNKEKTIPYYNAGFGYFQIFNSTVAKFDYVRAHDGHILDSFYISKD